MCVLSVSLTPKASLFQGRRVFCAMAVTMDTAIVSAQPARSWGCILFLLPTLCGAQGRVTAALREKVLWDHTLVIFHAGELRTRFCAGSPLVS